MVTNSISYKNSNSFSNIIIDYLDKKDNLIPFYNQYPNIENIQKQIELKQKEYSTNTRNILYNELVFQNKEIICTDFTKQNIEKLALNNTFTITTGHQLTLFTGPLYFLYKIISTINTCEELSNKYPNYNFVPIFWMATEDHDFEEVNHFYFDTKKITWKQNQKGIVGDINTESLKNLEAELITIFGDSINGKEIYQLFKETYLKNNVDLAASTRFLVNKLFGKYGLVCIDGNSKALKNVFKPIIRFDIFDRNSFNLVTKANYELEKNYKIQVNPREINLFYIDKNIRERIIFENNFYKINNTDLQFTETEIINLIDDNPEKFSPNVILRPVYQELILPNLAYIGGGGELAYWFQLKSVFENYKIQFPMLLLRNSALLITNKQKQKLLKFNLNWENIFQSKTKLINEYVKINSGFSIDFTEKIQFLNNQFYDLYFLAEHTDVSFVKAIDAQKIKQIKGLKNLEKKLLKAQKKKMEITIRQIENLKDSLFPSNLLQERYCNFSEFYIHHNKNIIDLLKNNLLPFSQNFTIITV